MSFRILSAVVGLALVVKSIAALMNPDRFYASRQRQYASSAMPRALLAGPAAVALMAAGAWYATIYHYVPWSWIVTGFVTGLLVMSLDHLCRWDAHRKAMLRVVTSRTVRLIDWCLLALGLGFLALAALVYGSA